MYFYFCFDLVQKMAPATLSSGQVPHTFLTTSVPSLCGDTVHFLFSLSYLSSRSLRTTHARISNVLGINGTVEAAAHRSWRPLIS